jgi:diaminopimelate decarboxylase
VNETLRTVADRHGSPCYVYFADRIRERLTRLREAFDDRFGISYAVKANPHPALLRILREDADRLDVSSDGELECALRAGWPAERIAFTGPAKSASELRLAVAAGIGEVVLESVEEARLLDEIARGRVGPVRVLIRVSPDDLPAGFGVRMAGRPTRFGIDEADLEPAIREVLGLSSLRLVGFHAYSGTQCLDADSVAENWAIFARIFGRATERAALESPLLIFGAGLGVPHHEGDEPLDIDAVVGRTAPILDGLPATSSPVLELGRWLVAEAGVYLTRVVRVKRSRGVDVAILDGGMHHHLAATGHLGSVIPRAYRMRKVTPPTDEERPYDLEGPLCTSVDSLGHGVRFPGLAAGDLIAVEASGAYGLTASPVHFIQRKRPREVLVETRDGETVIQDVTHESIG